MPMIRSNSLDNYCRYWLLILFILALSVPLSNPIAAAAAPIVSSHSPAAGATDVPASGTVTATFSEPLDPATVSPGSFVLSRPVRVNAIAAGKNFTLILKDNGTISGWGDNGSGQTMVPAGLDGVTAIAAGSGHATALKNDGTVIAWGDNALGQATVPAGLAGVAAISAGASFSLALKTDGTVVAWGDNSREQTSVPGGLAWITRIAAGSAHALALKSDGTVVAWGDNSFSQTTVPIGLTAVVAVAAAGNHSMALNADGSIVVWGADSSGQSSVPAALSGVTDIAAGLDFSLALKNDGSVVAWGGNAKGQTEVPVGLAGITAIAGGSYHVVVLKNDGTIVSWGDNSCSQTTLPAVLAGVTAVVAGSSHTLALKSDGTLFAWGNNSSGQINIPTGLGGITAAAAGFSHTLALTAAGTVYSCGGNESGQTAVPEGLAGVAAVAAGDYHSVAIKNNGTVVAWGLDNAGQTTVPAGLSAVAKIAAGSAHTLALKEDGGVIAWGSNAYNAGTTPLGLSGVTAIAAGRYHSVVLKNDGTLSAWGDNSQGQSTIPSGLSGVIAIAAGSTHTVALKSDGTLVAWGANDRGQTAVPAGLDRVVGIAAGDGYTVAVKNDGTLVGWGDNRIGQSTVPLDHYGQQIAASISYSTASNSATITPDAALPLATTLTATVNSGVRSLEGIHPPADFSWSFSTSAIPVTSASPAGGTYSSLQNVTLTANEPATIYYTTNGVTPTTASAVYAGPIPVAATITLKFFARDTAGNSETPQMAVYTFVADTIPPVTTPNPAGGTHTAVLNVTLTANEPATIYYTTNGATPTTSSAIYTGQIPVSVSGTLKFFARDTAGNSEAVKTAAYTINLDTTPPLTTASPPGGSYTTVLNVTLSANEPATIYYTTNGAAPTTFSAIYSGPIPVTVSRTLKFFARDPAGNNEAVKTVVYTINLDTTPPVTTASPPGGTYAAALNVTLTANEPANIYYTTNGNVPTVSSPVYSGAIPIPATAVLKYFARDTAGNNETVRMQSYTIKQNQTINFGPLPDKTYGDPSFLLGATSSSGLAITYTSSNPAVAVVSGTTLTIVGAGTTIVTAGQGGDGIYNAASSVARTLMVSKAPLTVQAVNATRAYGVQNPAFSVVYNGFVNGDSPAVLSGSAGLSTSATAGSPVGTYPITPAIGTLTAANYSFSFATGTLTIIKAVQTISFAPLAAKTFGDVPFTLDASADSGLSVGYTSSNPAVATVNGSAVTIIAAGSTVISASQGGDGNYSPALAVAQLLTVNKAAAVVTLGGLSAVFDGTPKAATATTVPAGLTVILTYNGAPTAPVAVASYSVVGSVSDANYQGSASGTLTIAKGEQVITFGVLPVKTYGDPAFDLGATASSGLGLSYTSSNPAVATVSGTMLTIAGAGTTTISASQGGDGNYNPAATVAQLLTINKAAAVVTLSGLSTIYDGTPKAASATTVPAGLNVTLTYDGAAPAPTAAAVYSVVGSVSDPNYQGSASGNLTIAKSDQTINFGALTAKTYGDPAFTLTASAGSGLPVTFTSSNPAVATVSGTTVTIVGAGTAIITASQGGDDNYNAAPAVAQSLSISKAAAVVTLSGLSTTYDGMPKAASATTLPAGLNVTLTYNGAPTAPTAVASYSVVGIVSDANYQGSASGTLTIAKGEQTISFGDLPVKTYGDPAFDPGATVSSALAVTYTSSNSAVAAVSGTTVTILGAGTATITASQPGDANYNAAPAVARTLTINKAQATLTFGLLAFTYDGSSKPVTVTTLPAGLAVAITYDGSATAPIDVGKYTVVAMVNDVNYHGSATATEEITKKSQTITFAPLPVKTYGDAPFTFTASASSNLNLAFNYDPAIATITKQGQKFLLTIVGAGTTIITATQAGNRNYSDAPPVSQMLTVNKAAGTLTLGSLSATFDGSAKAATATTSPAGLAVTFSYNGSATIPTAAGSYVVSGAINDANYQGSASGTMTIAKANQVITFDTLPAKIYGAVPFTLNAFASSGLNLGYTSSNPAVATISGATVTIVGVGTATITANQGGDNNFTAAVAVAQSLSVSKGVATITLGGLNTVYTGSMAAVAATTVPAGLQVTLTYNGSATAPLTVGVYTVAAVVGDANYEGSTAGTLTIDKSAQTILFAALPMKTFIDLPFSLDATASSGLPVSYTSSNPAVATISGTTVTIAGAGTTVITAVQNGDGNHSAAAAVPQTLTISKTTATVTLGGLNASYNGTARAATATTLPAGLPVTLTYNGSATAPAAAGTYPVTATISSPNYQGSSNGTLTIAKGGQTISFASLPAKTYGEPAFILAATATSGLTVTYTSSNTAVATVSGTLVTIVGAGTASITATQGGDANYDAATSVSQLLTVNAAPVATGRTAVTIGTTTSFHDTLTAALATIPAGSTTTIKLQTMTFTEAVTVNVSGATISISGGYDSGFTGSTGMTTIQGNLVITSGTLIADKLVII